MWKSQKLVSLRSDAEMRNMFEGLIPHDKSLDCVIDELVLDVSIRDTILTFNPLELKKKRMVSCLRENFLNDASAFEGFKRTIEDIENYFCK